MKEAILFIGLPGSGKTTYIEKNYKSGYIKVSADDFKEARPDLKLTSELEVMATKGLRPTTKYLFMHTMPMSLGNN